MSAPHPDARGTTMAAYRHLMKPEDAAAWHGRTVTLTTRPDPDKGEEARIYTRRVLLHPRPDCPWVELYRITGTEDLLGALRVRHLELDAVVFLADVAAIEEVE